MTGSDWVEHWVSGGVEDHGPNEDGYHATVRSHYPISTLPEHLHSTSLSHAETT